MTGTGTPCPMVGRVCVVTGATSGIGYETAMGLAGLGATVIGVGRSRERCEAARAAIRSACGADVVFEVADLGSQAEVRSLAGRIRRLTDRVDVLVNNAGVFTARRRVGPDGIEAQLAVRGCATWSSRGGGGRAASVPPGPPRPRASCGASSSRGAWDRRAPSVRTPWTPAW